MAALPWAELVLIDDPVPHPGALNMAIDEVLLAGLDEVALLRCYQWSEPSVSFGCFGRHASIRQDHPGRALVRRWTGGGIVEHGADFTFTLLVPRHLPLTRLKTRESYRLIHRAVASALSLAGLCTLESAEIPEKTPAQGSENAPFLRPCFANPVTHDLMLNGQKVVGGAQRRTKDGLLYQGSLQGPARIAKADDSLRQTLGESLAILFAEKWTLRRISAGELSSAEELAAKKYHSPAWTERF